MYFWVSFTLCVCCEELFIVCMQLCNNTKGSKHLAKYWKPIVVNKKSENLLTIETIAKLAKKSENLKIIVTISKLAKKSEILIIIETIADLIRVICISRRRTGTNEFIQILHRLNTYRRKLTTRSALIFPDIYISITHPTKTKIIRPSSCSGFSK